MPRAVAYSHKQKKEQLRRKRAIKRGELDPTPVAHSDRRRNPRIQHSAADNAVAESSRKLQSAFVKLSKDFLQETRLLSATLPLQRSIPSEVAVFADAAPLEAVHDGDTKSQQLTCPKRPKWRYDMSKKEVEANEEGLFKKWLAQTDAALDAWSKPAPAASPASRSPPADAREAEATSGVSGARESVDTEHMPHAPTSFERNLEVWRQL